MHLFNLKRLVWQSRWKQVEVLREGVEDIESGPEINMLEFAARGNPRYAATKP